MRGLPLYFYNPPGYGYGSGGGEPPLPSGVGKVCPDSNTGFHKWKPEHLWPKQWLPEGATPTGEPIETRARCVECGEITDDMSVLFPEATGPQCPSGTGF